jgi:hypothetical protein
MRILRWLLIVQSSYIMITAVWPIVDIESFIMVTGPKTDIWLVKTVGALLIPVALCLAVFLLPGTEPTAALVLGAGTAISFITVDFYYALNDVISDIYMADGVLQIAFLVAWIAVIADRYPPVNQKVPPP